jgi:hypothetical protein
VSLVLRHIQQGMMSPPLIARFNVVGMTAGCLDSQTSAEGETGSVLWETKGSDDSCALWCSVGWSNFRWDFGRQVAGSLQQQMSKRSFRTLAGGGRGMSEQNNVLSAIARLFQYS